MVTSGEFLLRGLVIGFSIAAPVGPIGILCIRRTLIFGQKVGFISGLGAATADACYGLVAALGLTVLTAFLVKQQNWLGLIGGLFLCYLGVRTFLEKPSPQLLETITNPEVAQQETSLLSSFGSTFFLTLTNPMTILAFAAIIAGFGLTSTSKNTVSAIALVLGVFLGSTAWWLLLSFLTNAIKGRVFRSQASNGGGSQGKLDLKLAFQWINWISGVLITAFGLIALGRGLLIG